MAKRFSQVIEDNMNEIIRLAEEVLKKNEFLDEDE